jgi:hypothetical protein
MASPASPEVPADLKADAERVLNQCSESLRKVLAALHPGEPAPRDLERRLNLHKTLCWRVLQVAFTRDPLAAAQHLPGDEGVEKFLAAAKAEGVSSQLLNPVREASHRYHTLVKSHAGDRASFEVMLMGLATPDETAVELKAARRAGFRSSSYAWGVQTAVRMIASIITPVGSDAVDLATLRGHIRVRRVRKEGLLRIAPTIEHDTDDPAKRGAAAAPIEPEHVIGGVPLLPRFSTNPLPPLQPFERSDRTMEYRFATQSLGEQSAITVFMGEVRRGLEGARWKSASNSTNAFMMTVRDPVGLGVIDLWAPPEFGLEHRAVTVSAIGVNPLTQHPDQWHVLPASTTVERMGRGLRAARLGEVPEYEPAISHCFSRLGWDASNYELHRLRLDYPILGSCLVLQTILPDRA